ncbi:MAG: hypothetical protein LBT53_02195, partial [Puniceicoccales bacterium]|nr:hypothetical protein [Puniceicoccales bacterium]
NRRRDLGLLIFPEPNPRAATTAAPRRIAVRHAAQTEFPDPKKRFDCESLFVWGGAVHTFTKRRSDTWTVLCKLRMESATAGVFEPVAAFDSNGMVTDAAVSPDGRRLAVLTYHCLWMFELPAAGAGTAATTAAPQNPLAGGAVWYRRLKFPADNWQAEGLAFSDARHVLIATEQGGLFTLDTATMTQVAGKK